MKSLTPYCLKDKEPNILRAVPLKDKGQYAVLPPELWDLILEKLSEINIIHLGLSRVISGYFNEIVLNNRNLKYKLFLLKHNLLGEPQKKWSVGGTTFLEKQLRFICEYGYLDVLKWLVKTLNLTDKNIKDFGNVAFHFACGYGHLKMAKWMNETFDFAVEKDAPSYWDDYYDYSENYSIRFSCAHGHLEMAKWLHSTFKLTIDDIRSDDDFAFIEAAENGHLEILKWLYSTFNLTIEVARSGKNSAFRNACENGHLEVAKWLAKTFGLTAKDARSCKNDALRCSCEKGHLEVAKWLVSTFKLTVEDVRSQHNHCLRSACELGHLELAEWLINTFHLTAGDIQGPIPRHRPWGSPAEQKI